MTGKLQQELSCDSAWGLWPFILSIKLTIKQLLFGDLNQVPPNRARPDPSSSLWGQSRVQRKRSAHELKGQCILTSNRLLFILSFEVKRFEGTSATLSIFWGGLLQEVDLESITSGIVTAGSSHQRSYHYRSKSIEDPSLVIVSHLTYPGAKGLGSCSGSVWPLSPSHLLRRTSSRSWPWENHQWDRYNWLQPPPQLWLSLWINRRSLRNHCKPSEPSGWQGRQELQLVGVTLEPQPLSEKDFIKKLTLGQSPMRSLQLAPATASAIAITLNQ